MSGTAPDGSPVELYARMPTFGEPEVVHAAIPTGADILELGAGAGRMTHRLIELGHSVTAVDESAEMLTHVRGAETIRGNIAGLDLGRRFGCVLLASHLVNVDDDRQRAAFLETCARHVASNGTVVLQRYDPGWAADPRPSESERDGITFRTIEPRRDGERLHATVEYRLGDRSWRHGPFTSRILADEELEARLWVAGLRAERWLDAAHSWLAAVPSPDTSALIVEVPEAEPLVREHRLRWDPAGAAVPAHVTILFPFLDPAVLHAEVLETLAGIAATVQPFRVTFRRVGRFPDVVWLAPDPVAPFADLTEAVVARWPDHQPYGGAFDTVVLHLTVADGAPSPVLERLERELPAGLPVTSSIAHLVLVCREGGRWRDVARFPLGRAGARFGAGTIGRDA